MEYHAIEDAEAWHKIQDVLEERVKAGVEAGIAAGERTMMGLIPYEIDAMKKVVAEKIRLFGSEGKAC